MNTFDIDILCFIHEHALVAPGDRVLVACSGGVDSVALLHFLAVNRKGLGIEVAAVHVDHMLRGTESAADGVLVEELCSALNIPFFGGTVPVPEILKNEGGNVQTICREERYAFFSTIMGKHDYGTLATAHHAEDQLETVLMQVTKGSTPTGIPITRSFESGVLIRPFLPTIKELIYRYASINKLAFHEDPSNQSDAYMRNRFRHHITPLILSENPNAAERVVSMANNLHEDERYLESLAKEQLEEIVVLTEERLPSVNLRTFTRMPTALQRRMIPLLLGYLYDEENVPKYYKSNLVNQLLHHIHSREGNITLDLPQGYQFSRAYDQLTFTQSRVDTVTNVRKAMHKGVQTKWQNDLYLYWNSVDDVDERLLALAEDVMYFDLPDSSLPISVRGRKVGDRIMLPGMTQLKRLSRLFIDEKISVADRNRLPIIVTAQDEVCAVPKLRYGAIFTKNRTDASNYILIISKN